MDDITSNAMKFFGIKKEESAKTSSKTSTKSLRDQSISELKAAFPSIRKPNADDSLYEILFSVGGTFSTLRIHMSYDFPLSKPCKSKSIVCWCFGEKTVHVGIQVIGTAEHPWLDQYKRVSTCPDV
jgi:hypothetical protein